MVSFNIIASSVESFIKKVLAQIRENPQRLYFGINAENINSTLPDQDFFNALKLPEATVFPEGMGPVYTARPKGLKIPERISITDLILQLLKNPIVK